MTLAAGATLGPYEVVELLGAGGMGEVYRARDPRLGREVAVKVLPSEMATEPERLRRFEREARAVAALNHPHILTVYDVGTDDGSHYVVTELVEGETLRETLDSRSPTQKQVLGFAVQAAQGLAAAHREGVVHHDLRPENLFVTTEGRLKILDFGLAKLAAPGAPGDTTGATDTGPTRPGVLMGTVACMSPEQVQALPVDARSDIFSFGVVLHESLSKRHPFRRETVAATLTAILHDTPPDLGAQATGLPPALAGIVGRCLEKLPGDRFQTSHDLALALEAVPQAPTDSAALQDLEERSPYPGLQSFTEKDASVFFGREGEVQELWARIRSRKLLAVIGPSGVGKTSFIRAGVLATRPPGWGSLVATPGSQPFRSLGRALGPELAGDSEALATIVDFEEAGTAFELLSRWRKGQEEALLVLDQFEELFTLNPREVQERFAELLGRLAREGDVHVVLSLRDDFLMGCHDHEPLVAVFRELTPLGALKAQDLRRALVEPAKEQDYRFEDEALVDEMVESVEGARAALPLLAFAVSRLWERRDREKKLLKRESYEAIGGVAGALAQHAEQTLDRIGPERQPLVREMFRNLVTSQGTRAAADREELLSVFTDKRESAEEVLKALVDSRLLTSYEATDLEGRAPEEPEPGDEGLPGPDRSHRIEIAHESLLKAWPRLVRWQAQGEEGAVLRDQLKQAARVWEDKGRMADVLWSGTALQEYQLWRERYRGQLTALEDDFAHSGIERDRRRKQVRRGLVAAAFVALAAVAAAIAVSRQDALDSARRAEASQLLALGQARLEDDPTEALALTTASLEMADNEEARVFAQRALWEAPPAFELPAELVMMTAFSPDGRWLAGAANAADVWVWSEDGTGPLRLPGHRVSAGNIMAQWTESGFLVTGMNGDERVHVWSFPGGQHVRTIDFGEQTYWEAGISHLFTETFAYGPVEERGLIRLRSWSLPDADEVDLGEVDPKAKGPRSVFEPTGGGWLYARGNEIYVHPLPTGSGPDRLVSRHPAEVWLFQGWMKGSPEKRFMRDANGAIQIWSFPPTGLHVDRVLPKPDTAPSVLLPSSRGQWLLGGGFNQWEEGELQIWNSTTWSGARPLVLRRSGSWYGSMARFHPREDWVVASTSELSRLTFWPLTKSYPSVVDGYSGLVRPLAFGPNGRWLATLWPSSVSAGGVGGGRAQAIRLWSLLGSGPREVRTAELPALSFFYGLTFDREGRLVLAVGDSASLVPTDGSERRELEEASVDTLQVGGAFSPSGRLVASASAFGQGEKTLRIWDLETGDAQVHELASDDHEANAGGYTDGVISLQFVDESTLLTAGYGGIRRWDLQDGSHELVATTSSPSAIMWMAASADGRIALTQEGQLQGEGRGPVALWDLEAGTSERLPAFGADTVRASMDPSGTVAVTGDRKGVVRVGRVAGGEPHLLLGHEGSLDSVAVSPDLRWVASSGQDNTLRLWPMPDLDKPPLHTLPRDELIAKLRSLTNIRAVRDPEAPNGWSIQLDPFPGWKEVPTW